MKSIENSLSREMVNFYGNNQIPLDSPQLLALSGGCDSVALLVLLHKKCPRLQAAYFNHNLREENELNREIEFIRELTSQLNIPLHIGEVPRKFLIDSARSLGASLEDRARKERYDFLEKIMEREKIPYLLLAHHRNDQTETLLARFFQGSGPAGLSGIRSIHGNRIRPLLNIPKSLLLLYLKEKKIPWSEDSSNQEDLYQRNSLRNRIIPSLKKTFPGIESSLSQLSEKMSRIDQYMTKESAKIPWLENQSKLYMALDDFNSLDPALREYSLMGALDRVLKDCLLSQGRGRRIPYRFIKPLLVQDLNHSFQLRGHGVRVHVKESNLILEREQIRTVYDFFFYLDREKIYLFYPWNVEWRKISRPDGKNVVLLLEEDEFPQVRSKDKGHILFESQNGDKLALWDGENWHISQRKLLNPSPSGIIITAIS